MVRVDKAVLMPFARYVVPDDVARSVGSKLSEKNVEFTCSCFNPYERRFGGQIGGGKIAFFRHSAWGDQLMATAVVRTLMSLFPDSRVDVYCSPTVISMWDGLTRAFPAPMIFDAIRAYDHHVFYEGMLENNWEPDQNNAIDDMIAFMGIDPEKVPPGLKVPTVVVKENDYVETKKLGVNLSSPYVLVQLQASNSNRTYPPKQTSEVIRLILERWKDTKVILVGQDKDGKWQEGIASLSSKNRFINLVNKLEEFRSIIPLVKHAKAVVAPDSSVGHLAAAFPSVPCVSLWGLFHPNDRVKYYTNHIPLFGDSCPHAPCHNHEFKLPQNLCKDASNAVAGEQKFCCALRSITPSQIVEKLEEAFAAKKQVNITMASPASSKKIITTIDD